MGAVGGPDSPGAFGGREAILDDLRVRRLDTEVQGFERLNDGLPVADGESLAQGVDADALVASLKFVRDSVQNSLALISGFFRGRLPEPRNPNEGQK